MSASRTPPYRVGIIGVGRMGSNHARAYMVNPKTELVAAADTDPENLELFQRRFGVNAYSDYHEMLAKERLDIAAPVLPVSVNPQAVIDCAEAGVGAIFSEKPIASSLADADRMVETCRARGIPFACGDAWRNLPQFWRFREMVDSGEVGEVRAINVYHSHNEILGGGCQSLGVTRLMAGDAGVEWVTGWVRGDPWDEGDQGMGGVIRFANGILAHVHMDPVGRRGIEVLTENGVFLSDWLQFSYHDAVDDGDDRVLHEREGLFERAGTWDLGYDDEGWREVGFRLTSSVRAIVEALETGREPRTSGDNMRKGLEIGIALRESHRRGHAPVALPLEDRSMKILPHPGRMYSKKGAQGREEYMEQMAAYKRD